MTPTSPVISVIIPAYNVEAYLSGTLDSLLAQTFEDFEIIVVNDCSPDGLSAIAHRYALRDGRVRVIDKPVNEGTMEARRTGYEAARGEYIVFCDGDDVMPANALAQMLSEMDAETDILLCSVRILWPGGQITYRPRTDVPVDSSRIESIYKALVRQQIAWYLCAGMFRRRLFEEPLQTFVGQCINEDYMLLLQLLQRARGVKFSTSYVYDYVRTDESATYGRQTMQKLLMDLKANQWCRAFMYERNLCTEEADWQYIRRVYKCVRRGFTRRQVLETGLVDEQLFNVRNMAHYLGVPFVMKYWFWSLVRGMKSPSQRFS